MKLRDNPNLHDSSYAPTGTDPHKNIHVVFVLALAHLRDGPRTWPATHSVSA